MNSIQQVVVYVHGIGRHAAGYSDSWYEALKPHLNQTWERREVLWSDLVNPQVRAAAMSAMERSADFLRLQAAIAGVLRDRYLTQPAEGTAPQPLAVGPQGAVEPLGSSPIQFDDFLVYMLNPAVRSQILGRFDMVVQPLLQSGATVQLVTHSWGTVVGYEGLRRLEAVPLSGQVANLFTVGSALSISPVQSNLFQRVQDGRRPSMVQLWHNLDARGDIVGGRIGNVFEVASPEHLGLEPVGCDSFLGLVRPSCAHGSYFHADNEVVNRDIFAASING